MEVREKLNDLKAELALARATIKREKEALAVTKKKILNAEKARKVVQTTAEAVQQKVHGQVAGVVKRCLKAVFGEEAYDFEIKFESKRGKTEARLVFLRAGKEIDPLSAAGGGVVDLSSFALRLACLVLSTPRKRRFLSLDEPFKHLSSEYRPLARELILALAKDLGIQFLVVTHFDDLQCGKVITLE